MREPPRTQLASGPAGRGFNIHSQGRAGLNGDGNLDIFVANIYIPLEQHRENISADRYDRLERYSQFVVKSDRVKGNTLLINRGDGEFVNRADAFGVRRGGWGWAASLTDFDNDGSLGLVQATQIVIRLDRDDPK